MSDPLAIIIGVVAGRLIVYGLVALWRRHKVDHPAGSWSLPSDIIVKGGKEPPNPPPSPVAHAAPPPPPPGQQ